MAHNLSMSFSSGIGVLLVGGSIFAACGLEETGSTPNGTASSSSSSGESSSSSGTGGGASSSSSGTGGGASSSSSGAGGTAGAGGAGGGTSSSSSSSGGPLPNGAACQTVGECQSGFCENKVCCNEPCGKCRSCKLENSTGTCTDLPIGADDCATEGLLCNDKQTCECGVSVPPTGTTCDAPWVNGPTPGSCVRKCDTQDACKVGTTTCPAGFDCIVECSGKASCSGNAVIQCPDKHACTVICSGEDACKGNNVNIQCSADGPCSMDCKNAAPGTCDGGPDLVCGNNACTATCEMMAGKPTLVPNASCGPTGC